MISEEEAAVVAEVVSSFCKKLQQPCEYENYEAEDMISFHIEIKNNSFFGVLNGPVQIIMIGCVFSKAI
jgi:hypothetical protein